MIFAKLKLYGTAVVGGLLFALGLAVKILMGRNKKLKKEATDATELADHAVEVIIHDNEVDIQADQRLADVVKEIHEGSAPSELTDPNTHWVRDKEPT